MDTAIVVFTRDLRLHDNPALYQACARAGQVVPLFVVDPAISAPSNRARFLAESLADLRASLRERGADLVLRRGDPAAEVIGLAAEVHATAVYIADDVSHYATACRHKLERECARHRIDLTLTPGLTVVPPAELKPAGGGHYRVFTPYWRAWRAAAWRRHYPVPQRIQLPPVEKTGRVPARESASPGLAPGGETAGRQRFVRWRPGGLAGYGERHDDLAGDATSRLSAYLRFGCVSPLEVAIGQRGGAGQQAGRGAPCPVHGRHSDLPANRIGRVLAGPDIFLRIDAGPIRRARGLEYAGMSRPEIRQWQPEPDPETPPPDLAALLGRVACGDHRAFELVYAELSGPVYGVVRQVLRDPAQSEEVAQEVLLEIWRTASRYDQDRGSAAAWALTIAHRRAVDRVRSEEACSRREQKAAEPEPAEDDVAETVAATLEHQRVRRCMDGLTGLQRESIKLAYYSGYSYPQVAQLLGVALGTVKTRIRDGLIRMRDCMEVTW